MITIKSFMGFSILNSRVAAWSRRGFCCCSIGGGSYYLIWESWISRSPQGHSLRTLKPCLWTLLNPTLGGLRQQPWAILEKHMKTVLTVPLIPHIRDSLFYGTSLYKRGIQKGQSKQPHCMSLKEKQNISSQKFIAKVPYPYIRTTLGKLVTVHFF